MNSIINGYYVALDIHYQREIGRAPLFSQLYKRYVWPSEEPDGNEIEELRLPTDFNSPSYAIQTLVTALPCRNRCRNALTFLANPVGWGLVFKFKQLGTLHPVSGSLDALD